MVNGWFFIYNYRFSCCPFLIIILRCCKFSREIKPPAPPPQDDNLDVTTYVVHILEKNSVQIPDLSPGTVYLFRVQAQGSDGSPGGSMVEEVFETSREGTEEAQNA